LQQLETSAFDLAIIDYRMPYIDGLETARMIRQQRKLSPHELPVILCTVQQKTDAIRGPLRVVWACNSHWSRAVKLTPCGNCSAISIGRHAGPEEGFIMAPEHSPQPGQHRTLPFVPKTPPFKHAAGSITPSASLPGAHILERGQRLAAVRAVAAHTVDLVLHGTSRCRANDRHRRDHAESSA
jgi:CheY-like chemotaxis protein